ncbi:hypothetical protein GCM10029992_61200 [Glycomyces albus]
MELRDELLSAERAGWDALCEGTGAEFYGSKMTEDGMMVLAHGFALDRSEVAASLREAPPWSGYEITDTRLICLGSDAAAITYRARAWRDGEDTEFTALMSSVYTRTEGSWKLALYQQTPTSG